jgi:hypothetical protein
LAPTPHHLKHQQSSVSPTNIGVAQTSFVTSSGNCAAAMKCRPDAFHPDLLFMLYGKDTMCHAMQHRHNIDLQLACISRGNKSKTICIVPHPPNPPRSRTKHSEAQTSFTCTAQHDRNLSEPFFRVHLTPRVRWKSAWKIWTSAAMPLNANGSLRRLLWC